MFVTYDQQGTIQAIISGPGLEYGELLDKQGKSWLFLEGVTALDPRFNHVDIATKAVVPHHALALAANKTTIAADGVDVATITGIPVGAAVTVLCNGDQVAGEIVNDGHLEITAAAPATYKIMVSCATYNPAEIEVIAQ